MNNQEKVLEMVHDYPGNCVDVASISKWTGLKPKSIYKAAEHLENRGAIKKEKEIILLKGHIPLIKLKIKITPKKLSKALWILNKMDYKN